MNIDTFKGLLATQTTPRGFAWSEEQTDDKSIAVLSCNIGFPYYDDDCVIRVVVSQKTLEVVFLLDAIVPTFDNLKLVNDFNAQVSYLKAHIHKTQKSYLLFISSGIINVDNEQTAVNNVVSLVDYVASQDVAIYLRPLTVITQ